MPRVKIGDLVEIVWEDHYNNGTPGWRELSEIDTKPCLVTSVGYIVAETKGLLFIAPTVYKEEEGIQFCGGYSARIKTDIKKLTILKKAK